MSAAARTMGRRSRRADRSQPGASRPASAFTYGVDEEARGEETSAR